MGNVRRDVLSGFSYLLILMTPLPQVASGLLLAIVVAACATSQRPTTADNTGRVTPSASDSADVSVRPATASAGGMQHSPGMVHTAGMDHAAMHGATSGAQPVTPRTNTDSAFTGVQWRGADARAMGVDQYTSVHKFDALPDGGRIELQRASDDSAGTAQIREHLQGIAQAFGNGDFTTPAFVHMQDVPGSKTMAAKRAVITYTMRELPRGGEVRITTTDAEALRAVHEFMAFQRMDHRAGGAGTP